MITKPGQSEHVDGLSHLPWPAQSTQTTVYIFGEKSEKAISSSTISEVTGRCSDRQYFTEDYSKLFESLLRRLEAVLKVYPKYIVFCPSPVSEREI